MGLSAPRKPPQLRAFADPTSPAPSGGDSIQSTGPIANISVRLGVKPDVYYVPVTVVSGPPYGRALGHYKNKHRKQWSSIVLSDADMVNLVELQFLSEHYHVAPERIIEMRGRDRDFVAINAEFRGGGGGGGKGRDDQDGNSQGNGKGSKGHGKGRGRN